MYLNKIRSTLITTALIALGACLADYVINVLIAGHPEIFTPETTFLIATVVGLPVCYYLFSQRYDIMAGREALAAARDAAERANQAKSDFLAVVSHEIRTPLNGVLGMAQVMAGDDLSPAQQERLQVIRQSGEALLTVLDDILDATKVEAGRLTLEARDFDLSPLLAATRARFSGIALVKGVTLALEIAPEAPGKYRGDPLRLGQILNNLIANAVKFTEQGGVRLIAARQADDLVIEIVDTGVGISRAALDRLFERFTQAEASITRRFGGTGLGLAIARDLARLMGGDIVAESTEGRGSLFRVTLPLPLLGPETPAAPEPRAATVAPRKLRVLAAEDIDVNRQVLQALLRQLGIEPVMVADGAAAVAAHEEQEWDLVLMDVQMPVLDGLQATRRIRRAEAGAGRKPVPILALTANVMAEQIAEYGAAGMDGVVTKPLNKLKLAEAIDRALADAVMRAVA